MRIDILTVSGGPQNPNKVDDPSVAGGFRAWDGNPGGWSCLDLEPTYVEVPSTLPPIPGGAGHSRLLLSPIGESIYGRHMGQVFAGMEIGATYRVSFWVYMENGSSPLLRFGINDGTQWLGGHQDAIDHTPFYDTWNFITFDWVYPVTGLGQAHFHMFYNEDGPSPPRKASEGNGTGTLGIGGVTVRKL